MEIVMTTFKLIILVCFAILGLKMAITISAYKAKHPFYNYYGHDIDEELAMKAREYWLKTLTLATEPDDYALKVFIIVGKQYMGKTHAMNELVYWIHNIPGNQGNVAAVQMHDLRPIYNPRYKKLWTKPVQVLIFEDAARHWDPRNSIGNRKKTWDYLEVRHIYEEMGYGTKGQIFLIFNVQTWGLVDVRVRETFDVAIIKNYFGTDWFKWLIKNPMHRTFARDFTENATIFSMQEEKQFCLGRTSSEREFLWSLPYKEPDPITGKMTKVKDLVKKYELIHTLDMLTLEMEVLKKLENDLLKDEYFELKNIKQIHGWLEEKAIEKYNAENLRLEFSERDFNQVIKRVAHKRFYLNLDKTQEFTEYLEKKLPERFPLDITPLERLLIHARKKAREQKLYFLKDKQITNILKEILVDYPVTTKDDKEDITSRLDPNEKPTKKEQVINAIHAEGVTNIDRIIERTGFSRKSIADILSKYNDLFENLSEDDEIERGVYCLKGHVPLQNELMKYQIPKRKKLKMT